MSDLISRQAALDIAFKYCPDDDGTCSEAGADLRDMLDELENLPPAQSDIIRCKDCRWYKTNYMWNGTEVKICAKEAYEPKRNADDFCSYGERK